MKKKLIIALGIFSVVMLTLTTLTKNTLETQNIVVREVLEDSRCPADEGIACFWQGELKVRADIFGKKDVEISWNKELVIKNKEVRLKYAEPNRYSNRAIAPEDYLFIFTVTTKQGMDELRIPLTQ